MKNRGVKLRHFIAILCVAFLAAASLLGVVHDHSDNYGWSEPHHCHACEWQMAAVGDIPLVFILVLFGIVVTRPWSDSSISLPVVFSLTLAGRGPPQG